MSSKTASTPSIDPPETEVLVEVYDLLQPGRLASLVWTLSMPFVHTTVHLPSLELELAFGAHPEPSVTGVYTTHPTRTPPPGSRHCRTVHRGTIRMQPAEIGDEIKAASKVWLGTEYNLLTRNCNHFSDYLLRKLTGKGLPGWCNRAARLGVAFPCLVPAEWIEPPTADADEADLVPVEEDADILPSQAEATRRTMDGRVIKAPASRAEHAKDDEGRELPLPEAALTTTKTEAGMTRR